MTIHVIPIGSVPVVVLHNNGKVGFEKLNNFATVIDQPEVGIQAIISNDDIFVGAETELLYNVWYDIENMPEAKAWLVASKLVKQDIK